MSYDDMRGAVAQQIEAAGGSITHADLVDNLGRGADAIARQLPAMVANGHVYARLVASGDGNPPVLRYSLAATAPTAPSGGDA
jgi:hypothetical protein